MRRKIKITTLLVMLSLLTTSMTFSYWANYVLGASQTMNLGISIGDWVLEDHIPIPMNRIS